MLKLQHPPHVSCVSVYIVPTQYIPLIFSIFIGCFKFKVIQMNCCLFDLWVMFLVTVRFYTVSKAFHKYLQEKQCINKDDVMFT